MIVKIRYGLVEKILSVLKIFLNIFKFGATESTKLSKVMGQLIDLNNKEKIFDGSRIRKDKKFKI
ncbi:hypothetical protein BpHYR1_031663 [Brachionus plicatilis]|uniref:Uncharacterized protein n=1 Tax=Brachionus plicatilis TaxID=10195 RepID=A0A3M7QGK7_BRAPC|nr:hypothetical protein BpHYR1_031663 [Brachionus plicatilis]